MLRFRSATGYGRALVILGLSVALGSLAFAGEGKGKHRKAAAKAAVQQETDPATAEKNDLSAVPLPIGHEAKGVVIPDYDGQGRLSNRFNAGIAKRIDTENIQLRDLKMNTFTPQQKPDLSIVMSDSVLNLKTRILTSPQHTTVKRADFEIVGDTIKFNTATRQGTMTGNVKMTIYGASELLPKGTK